MHLDGASRNRQAQSRSTRIAAARRVGAIERASQFVQLRLENTGATVAHVDDVVVCRLFADDGHLAPGRCISRRVADHVVEGNAARYAPDRKSTRLNSSHSQISYAVFCLKKKTSQSAWNNILACLPSS